MANNVHTEEIKNLVKTLVPFELDSENFKRCLDCIPRYIFNKQYFSPSYDVIRENFEQISLKYNVLGFSKYSTLLSASVKNVLDLETNVQNQNIKFLDFMLHLSSYPFKTDVLFNVEDRYQLIRTASLSEVLFEEDEDSFREDFEEYSMSADDKDKVSENLILKNVNSELSLKSHVEKRIYNELFEEFCQKEIKANDIKTELINVIKDVNNSKNFLLNNIQNSWWYTQQNVEQDNYHISSVLAINKEKLQNELVLSHLVNSKCHLYSEYKIIRELLWIVFCDHTQMLKNVERLRLQISVSTLFQETFVSFINDFLRVVEKYSVLYSYCEDVLSDISYNPKSFQAYALALRSVCDPFVQKIIEQENILLKQNNNTLLRVIDNLRPNLKEIEFIYEIHEEFISCDFKELIWLRVTSLLSILFSKFEKIISHSFTKIILEIFFRTFNVYTDIIDCWLTEGQLHDWSDEFFIRQLDDNKHVCFLTSNKNICETPIICLFNKISELLLNCSANIEFLCKLNKIQELRNELLKEDKLIILFTKRFINKLLCYCPEINKNMNYEQNENSEVLYSPLNKLFKEHYELRSDESPNIYLLLAFSDHLYQNYNLVKRNTQEFDELILNLQNLKIELVPVSHIFADTLYEVIKSKTDIVNNYFKDSLINEYKFFEHVKNLCAIMLMNFHKICYRINEQFKKNLWEGNHILIEFLYDCLDSNKLSFKNLFNFTIKKDDQFVKDLSDLSILKICEILNFIQLKYTVQWPLNMIFSDYVVEEFYGAIFNLILKINFAMFSVSRLQYKDLAAGKVFVNKYRQIQLFRYWILQLLQKIRYYLILNISQFLDHKLLQRTIKIDTFNNLREDYLKYLKNIEIKCLIERSISEFISKALKKLWNLCDDIRCLWVKGKKLRLTMLDVSKLLDSYLHCLNYLVQVFEKISKKIQISDPLYLLWIDLRYMLKINLHIMNKN